MSHSPDTTNLPSGWVRLLDLPDGLTLCRGAVLRATHTAYPYESVVDFMLVERPESASGLKLMVSSGYHAGVTRQVLPDEACGSATQRGLSSTWLKANWANWVYPECPADKVWFSAGYPVPVVPTPGEPAPTLVWNQEPGNEADLYHSLADEFHLDMGQMLDEVLQRHQLPLTQRRAITSSFLFELMDRLDEGAVYQLEDQAFVNQPALKNFLSAKVPWRASLAFLRHLPEESGEAGEQGDGENDDVLQLGALQEVLLSNDTWLHEACGDPLDAYFDAQATQTAPGPSAMPPATAPATPPATAHKDKGDA